MPRDLPHSFDYLLEQLEPEVRAAFEEALQQNRISAKRIAELIEAGQIEALLDELNISPEYFSAVRDAVDAAFYEGARFQGTQFAALAPFNRRHWQAEEWARQNGSRLIVEISENTREGVRTFVQEALEAGRNSNTIARDIAGRTNRVTGKREGGIVGLTGQQASFVTNARDELEKLDASYFQRAARDRRYDSMVRKAIKAGKPLAKGDVDRIVQRYMDGMLIRRADIIARTETHRALNAGRYEAMRQNAENAGVPESAITVKWQATLDGRVRDTHRMMNKKTVPYGQPFVSPSGARMKFPGDRDLGAPGAETIHCRCTTTFSLDLP